MGKKLQAFLALVLTAMGGGMVYVSSSSLMNASADDLALAKGDATIVSVIVLVIGGLFVASGVITAVFAFVANSAVRR